VASVKAAAAVVLELCAIATGQPWVCEKFVSTLLVKCVVELPATQALNDHERSFGEPRMHYREMG
jgi:hypothetical protein